MSEHAVKSAREVTIIQTVQNPYPPIRGNNFNFISDFIPDRTSQIVVHGDGNTLTITETQAQDLVHLLADMLFDEKRFEGNPSTTTAKCQRRWKLMSDNPDEPTKNPIMRSTEWRKKVYRPVTIDSRTGKVIDLETREPISDDELNEMIKHQE